jgi:hypothetical protein
VKDQVGQTRRSFAISFWGAVFVGLITFIVGNNWITVFERSAVGFLVLVVVSTMIRFLFSTIQSQPLQPNVTKGGTIDYTLPPEIPENESADFIPWDFSTQSTESKSQFHSQMDQNHEIGGATK